MQQLILPTYHKKLHKVPTTNICNAICSFKISSNTERKGKTSALLQTYVFSSTTPKIITDLTAFGISNFPNEFVGGTRMWK